MRDTESFDWVKVAACGSLITGSLLLLTGKKRAGLVMAASGTALALLDHEDTLRNLWEATPSYVERAQLCSGRCRTWWRILRKRANHCVACCDARNEARFPAASFPLR